MLTIDKIKGIIFDYGGTIDSNGLHWAEVIWKAYETYQVSVAKADFRNAFVYGERTLGKNPLVKPEHTFLDMLRIKIDLQLEWLKEEGLITPADASSQKKEDIAQWSYANARKHIDIALALIQLPGSFILLFHFQTESCHTLFFVLFHISEILTSKSFGTILF